MRIRGPNGHTLGMIKRSGACVTPVHTAREAVADLPVYLCNRRGEGPTGPRLVHRAQLTLSMRTTGSGVIVARPAGCVVYLRRPQIVRRRPECQFSLTATPYFVHSGWITSAATVGVRSEEHTDSAGVYWLASATLRGDALGLLGSGRLRKCPRSACRRLVPWPQTETRASKNARTSIIVRTFWLVSGGGQGQGRTADLPLFRH